MARFFRRSRSRRPAFRRRTTYRRRSTTRKSKQGRNQSKVVYFERTQRWASVSSDGAGTFQTAYSWKLNDVNGYTEFSALFESYKIRKIKVKLIPFNPQIANLADANVGSTIDYNDTTAFNIAQLGEYSTFRRARLGKTHTRTFYPRNLTNVFSSTGGVGGTGYASTRNLWLDTTYNNVVHYGYKISGSGCPVSTQLYEMYITFSLAFKNYR